MNISKTTVFLSELLRDRFPVTCKNLTDILDKHNISYQFLRATKDIWCRDYMPIQTKSGKLVQFRYEPSYLKGFEDLRSDTKEVCKANGIQPDAISKINLDGGNVLICEDRAIISDRVFSENPEYTDKNKLISDIEYLKDWNVCSKSNAEYYRLITLDDSGKSIGKVMDYYITGELYWEGRFSYFNKENNNENVKEGICIRYYKNGKKATEEDFKNGLPNGIVKNYFESGNLKSEVMYTNGEAEWDVLYYENGKKQFESREDFRNGVPIFILKEYYEGGNLSKEAVFTNEMELESSVVYYENGNLYRKLKFINGKLDGKFFIGYDEFGNSQNIFYDDFATADNVNGWNLVKDDDNGIVSEILPKKGLLMQNNVDNSFIQAVDIPLDLSNDFSIETAVDFKDGKTDSGYGLMWGGKDLDNYSALMISANGYYRIDEMFKGKHIPVKEWTPTRAIKQNQPRNLIRICRVKDKISYSINEQPVYFGDFYGFRGNQIGFISGLGQKEILFEYLIVRQFLSGSSSDWKGIGSGFFIDCRGYIVTNYHVVKDATEIEIEFIRNEQKQTFKAEVVHSDKQNDLAVIKISDNLFKPFVNLPYNFKQSTSDVGTDVFALGYPLTQIMGNEIKFTDGKISSKTGFQGDITIYQITVPIQFGSSGGPLFDYEGNLIGIISSGLSKKLAANVNYAIKSSYLKNLLDVLPVTVELPNDPSIANKTLTEKIKILSDYVVLIKVK